MQRELLKTGTFAALNVGVCFTISYAFTGSVMIASGIAMVDPLVSTIVFYFHERAWNSEAQGENVSA
jgi:uncharacterized membrane protein